jgi:hypothetical protein
MNDRHKKLVAARKRLERLMPLLQTAFKAGAITGAFLQAEYSEGYLDEKEVRNEALLRKKREKYEHVFETALRAISEDVRSTEDE